MLWPIGISCDEWNIDIILSNSRKLFLCLLSFVLEALHGGVIFAQIDTFFGLKVIEEVIDDGIVEVLTTKVSVTVGRLHLEELIGNLQHRHVEGTTTKVKDNNVLFFAFIETVSESSCRWLIDNALDFQASNLTRILGSLALRIVEVGWHGNDRLCYLLAQEGFGISLDLA